jgi:hypothetical protein
LGSQDDLFRVRGELELTDGPENFSGIATLTGRRLGRAFELSLQLNGQEQPSGAISGVYDGEFSGDAISSTTAGSFDGILDDGILSLDLAGSDVDSTDETCALDATFQQTTETVWSEVGDAGNGVASAQDVGEGIDRIDGTFSDGQDADVFRVHVADPQNFSALVHGAYVLDSQVFLLRLDGTGIAGNDDLNGGDPVNACDFDGCWSGLPGDHPLLDGLTSGDYLIAVSQWDYDPVNDSFDEIFADFADSEEDEGVFGPTGPGGSDPLDGFAIGDGEIGLWEDYSITMTGTVPEPDETLLRVVALASLLACARRRRPTRSGPATRSFTGMLR